MYKASDGYNEKIKSASRTFAAKIEVLGANSNVIETITENIKSIKTVEISNTENDYTFGSVASGYADVTINQPSITFENRKIKIYIGMEIDGEIEYVPQGVYMVDKATANERMTSFTAFDNISRLDKPYASKLPNFTNTIDVLEEIALLEDVEINTSELFGIEMIKPAGYKYREILGRIAQLYGGFAICNREGVITIKDFEETDNAIPTGLYFDAFHRAEYPYRFGRIVCHSVRNLTGEETILRVGNGTHIMQFTNRFMTQAFLNDIYARKQDFSFMPGTLKFMGDNRIDAWDILTVTDLEGIDFKLPAMKITQTFDGGLTTEVEAIGMSETESERDKNISIGQLVEIVREERVVVVQYTNATAYQVNSISQKIIGIEYAATSATFADFKAAILIDVEEDDTLLEFSYLSNYVEDTAFSPRQLLQTGKHIINLIYPINIVANRTHVFEVYVEAKNGSASIGMAQIKATIIGQGLSNNGGEWNGLISIEERMGRIPLGSSRNMPKMIETVGVALGTSIPAVFIERLGKIRRGGFTMPALTEEVLAQMVIEFHAFKTYPGDFVENDFFESTENGIELLAEIEESQALYTVWANMTHQSIFGIETVSIVGSESLLFAIDFGNGWQAYNGTFWVSLSEELTGMTLEQMQGIGVNEWVQVSGEEIRFRVVVGVDDYVETIEVKFLN